GTASRPPRTAGCASGSARPRWVRRPVRTTPGRPATPPSGTGRPPDRTGRTTAAATSRWARGTRRAAATSTWKTTGSETMTGVEGDEGPFVTRRQELGAASARSLLLTVLGEFVLPASTSVWTATLLDLLADLDVAEKATRQAIMRTADSGWISGHRRGRETRWSLTEAGTRLLKEGTDRIYGFASDQRVWDGRWLLLTVAVPENARALRQRLRT